jgi:hypothetical protein
MPAKQLLHTDSAAFTNSHTHRQNNRGPTHGSQRNTRHRRIAALARIGSTKYGQRQDWLGFWYLSEAQQFCTSPRMANARIDWASGYLSEAQQFCAFRSVSSAFISGKVLSSDAPITRFPRPPILSLLCVPSYPLWSRVFVIPFVIFSLMRREPCAD